MTEDDTTMVFASDTEALLQSPMIDVDRFYFKVKLNLHNMTFSNLKDCTAMNFL